MDAASLLLGLALLILVAAYVARPLFERSPEPVAESDPSDGLLAERENVLAALRDLDFDFRTGKVAAEDYEAQRAALVTQGAAVLQQLDASAANGEPPADDLEAEIEAAIAAHRQSAKKPSRAPVSPVTASAQVCSSCGAAIRAGDRFCAACGTPVAAAPATRRPAKRRRQV